MRPDTRNSTSFLKLLSLVTALLLWLFVSFGQESTLAVQVPVEVRRIPSGLAIVSGVPTSIAVTFSGPRFQVQRLARQPALLPLDLAGVREGTVVFPSLGKLLSVPAGVQVTRIYPAALELRLEKVAVR